MHVSRCIVPSFFEEITGLACSVDHSSQNYSFQLCFNNLAVIFDEYLALVYFIRHD